MKVLAVSTNKSSSSKAVNQLNSRMKLPVQDVAHSQNHAVKSAAVITNNGDHWPSDQLVREETAKNSAVNGFSPSRGAALSTMKESPNSETYGQKGPDAECLTSIVAVPISNGVSSGECHFLSSGMDVDATLQLDTNANAVTLQPLSVSMPLTSSTAAAEHFASSVMAMPATSFASASREFESSISALETCMTSLNTMSNDVAFVVGERTAVAATKIHDMLHKKLGEIYRQQNASTSRVNVCARSRSGLHEAPGNSSVLDIGDVHRKFIEDPTAAEIAARIVPCESLPNSTAPSTCTKQHAVKFDWNLVEELRFRSTIAARGVRTIQHAIDEYATDSSSAGSSDDEEVEHGRAVSFDDNKWCGVPIKKRSLHRYAAERARLMKEMKYCHLQANQIQNWFRQLIILRHMHKQGESSPIDPFHLMLRGSHQHKTKGLQDQQHHAGKLPVESAVICSARGPTVESATSTRSGSPRRPAAQTVESIIRPTRSPGRTRDMWWSDFKQNDDKMIAELQAELTAIDRRDNNMPENHNNVLPLRSFLMPLAKSAVDNTITTNGDTDDDDDDDDEEVVSDALPPSADAVFERSLRNKLEKPSENLTALPDGGASRSSTVAHPLSESTNVAVQSASSQNLRNVQTVDRTMSDNNRSPVNRLKPVRWRPDLIDARRRQQSLFINSACNVVTVSTGHGGRHAGVSGETQEPVSWIALARASGLQLDAIAQEAQTYVDRHPQFRHLSKIICKDDQYNQHFGAFPAKESTFKHVAEASDDPGTPLKPILPASGLRASSATSVVSESILPPNIATSVTISGTNAAENDSMYELSTRCKPVQQYLTNQQRPKLFLLNERISISTSAAESNKQVKEVGSMKPCTVIPSVVRPYRLSSSYRYKDLNKASLVAENSDAHQYSPNGRRQNIDAGKNSNNNLVSALNRHRNAPQQIHPHHISFQIDTYPYAVSENCLGAFSRPHRGSAHYDGSSTAWNLIPTSERDAVSSLNAATSNIGSTFDDDVLDHPALYNDTRQSWLAGALRTLNPFAANTKTDSDTTHVAVPANDSYEDQALLPHRAFFGAGLGEQRRDAVRREQRIERARFIVFQTVQKAYRDRIKYQNLMHSDGAKKGKDLSRLRAHLRYILHQEQQQLNPDELGGEVRSVAEQFVADTQRKLLLKKRRQLLYKQNKQNQLQQQQHQQSSQGSLKKIKKRKRVTTSSEDEEPDDEDDFDDKRRRRRRSNSKHMRSRRLDENGNEFSSSEEEETDSDDQTSSKRLAGGSDEEDESAETNNENLFLLGTLPHHVNYLAGSRVRGKAVGNNASGGRVRAATGKKHNFVEQHHGKSSMMAKGGRKKSFGAGGASAAGGANSSSRVSAGGVAAAGEEAASSTYGDTYVVPFGHFGPPRVEKLDYKEIKTPQWRRVVIVDVVAQAGDNNAPREAVEDAEISATGRQITEAAANVAQRLSETDGAAAVVPIGAVQPVTRRASMDDFDDLNVPTEIFAPTPRPHMLCQALEEVLTELLAQESSGPTSSTASATSSSTIVSSQDELLKAFENVMLVAVKLASASPSSEFVPPANIPPSNSGNKPSSIVVVIKKKQQVLTDRMLMPPPPTPPRSIISVTSSTETAPVDAVNNGKASGTSDGQQTASHYDEPSSTSVTPPDMTFAGSASMAAPNSPMISSDVADAADAATLAEREDLFDSAFEGRHASCEQEERQKIMEYLKNLDTRRRGGRQAAGSQQVLDKQSPSVGGENAVLNASVSALQSDTVLVNSQQDDKQPFDAAVATQNQEQGDVYEQHIFENFVYDLGYELRGFPLAHDIANLLSPADADMNGTIESGQSMRYTIRRRVNLPKQPHLPQQSPHHHSNSDSGIHHNKSYNFPAPQLPNELHANRRQNHPGREKAQRSVGGNFALLKHSRGHSSAGVETDYAAAEASPSHLDDGDENAGSVQQFDLVDDQVDGGGSSQQPSWQSAGNCSQSSGGYSQPLASHSAAAAVNPHLLARLTGAVKGPKTRRPKQQLRIKVDKRVSQSNLDYDEEPTTPPGSPPPELVKRLSVSIAGKSIENDSTSGTGSSNASDELNIQQFQTNDTVGAETNIHYAELSLLVKREQPDEEDAVFIAEPSSFENLISAPTAPTVNAEPTAELGGKSSQLLPETHAHSFVEEKLHHLKKSPALSRSRSLRRSSQTSQDCISDVANDGDAETRIIPGKAEEPSAGDVGKDLSQVTVAMATRRVTRRQAAAQK